jgi:hypothetical protein
MSFGGSLQHGTTPTFPTKALVTFKASGEFDPSTREWRAKPLASRTFANFCTFMQKASANRTKHNKSTAKATHHGITNSATDQTMDKVNEAKAAALAIAKVAMILQSNQDE